MGKTELADPDQLLGRLSEGKELSDDESLQLISLLEGWGADGSFRERSLDDLYAYLVVMRKARLTEHHRLLEKFLDTKDTLTVGLVLETLCVDWSLSSEYLERAVSFSIGAPWDTDGDAREQALKILGEHLRSSHLPSVIDGTRDLSTSQKEVLNLLFNTTEDPDNSDWVRQAAYFSIARGFGRDWEELPPECSLLSFEENSEDVDREMLNKVKALLST